MRSIMKNRRNVCAFVLCAICMFLFLTDTQFANPSNQAQELDGFYSHEYLNRIALPMRGVVASMISFEGVGALSKVSLKHQMDGIHEPSAFAAICIIGRIKSPKYWQGRFSNEHCLVNYAYSRKRMNWTTTELTISSRSWMLPFVHTRYEAVNKKLFIDSNVAKDFRVTWSTVTGVATVGLKYGAPFIKINYRDVWIEKCLDLGKLKRIKKNGFYIIQIIRGKKLPDSLNEYKWGRQWKISNLVLTS